MSSQGSIRAQPWSLLQVCLWVPYSSLGSQDIDPANLELTRKDKVGGAHASRSMVHRRGGAGVQAVGAKAGSRQTERVARTALGLNTRPQQPSWAWHRAPVLLCIVYTAQLIKKSQTLFTAFLHLCQLAAFSGGTEAWLTSWWHLCSLTTGSSIMGRKNRIINWGTLESEGKETSEATDSRSSQALLCVCITSGDGWIFKEHPGKANASRSDLVSWFSTLAIWYNDLGSFKSTNFWPHSIPVNSEFLAIGLGHKNYWKATLVITVGHQDWKQLIWASYRKYMAQRGVKTCPMSHSKWERERERASCIESRWPLVRCELLAPAGICESKEDGQCHPGKLDALKCQPLCRGWSFRRLCTYIVSELLTRKHTFNSKNPDPFYNASSFLLNLSAHPSGISP